MAQAKIIWLIADILGIPMTVLGILANLDNFKSVILLIIATGYLCTRWYFYVVQKKQAVREKEIEIWNKEQDKLDRIKQSV